MNTITIERGPPTGGGTFHVDDEYEWHGGKAHYNGVIRGIVPLGEHRFKLSVDMSDEEYLRLLQNS
jgi:hypothetical protein